jgi:hypothetical protein
MLKVHTPGDGHSTACNINSSAFGVTTSEVEDEVTCLKCRKKLKRQHLLEIIDQRAEDRRE